MDKIVLDTISDSFLFNKITKKEIEHVANTLKPRIIRLSPKEVLFKEGDLINEIGVVLSGEIKISKYNYDGNENLLGKIKKYQTIGANITYTPTRISPFYLYSRGVSRLFLFNYENIDKLEREKSDIIYKNIMLYLSNDNIRKQYKIDIISNNKIRDRILTYLMIQKDKKGKDEFYIPYNREEMAEYLCVNRSVLSHELSVMRAEGVIDFKKNYFKILI